MDSSFPGPGHSGLKYSSGKNHARKRRFWSLAQLESRPTIRSGHFDNLKIDDGAVRVWLSRCGIADGMPYDNGVTVEVLRRGDWKTVDEYEAV